MEVKKLSAWSFYFFLGIDEFSVIGGGTVADNLKNILPFKPFPITLMVPLCAERGRSEIQRRC